MGKTYTGGGSDFWKDYDGTDAPKEGEGQDFWSDLDMWEAMRQADELAISAEERELADADLAYDDEGELDLLNNIDLALEAGRGTHYSNTAGGYKCNGCGQRYGHSVYCPHVKDRTYGNVTSLSDVQAARRADATSAFTSREYKDWSRSNRGGSNASRGTRPTAVLVDMDGTIDDYGRPNSFGMAYVREMHAAGHVIVICTARTHGFEYESSHKWLVRELSHKYGIPFVGPFCRSRDDMRFACHYKRAVMESLGGVYDFVGAIDDDTWCLSELRKVQGLDVVTAKPGAPKVYKYGTTSAHQYTKPAPKHQRKSRKGKGR